MTGREYLGEFEQLVLLVEGTLAVNEKKQPKTFDLKFTAGPEKGNTSLGIYELDGDSWKICLTLKGTKRPTAFATKRCSGLALETLEREEPGKAKPKPSAPVHLEPAPELEGEWAMETMLTDGVPLEAGYAQFGRRLAKGNEMKVTMAGQTIMKVQFTVDRSKQPHEMGYIAPGGQIQLGIYELRGGKLQTNFAPPGQPRPSDFTCAKGSGRRLTVWRRL